MEYKRPKRYVTYYSTKCKTYLAKDFNHECAYCKFKEMLAVSQNGWEIDHFKPINKFKEWEGVNKYENLFYACKTCNSNKSDTWSETLLNPCKDDIYNVHIKENESHEMIAITEQGKEYIETLKMNAMQSVLRRRKLARLNKLKGLSKVLKENDQEIQDICNETQNSEFIKIFQDFLLKKCNINSTYGLYEYDLDFKLNYNEKEVYCDLNFESNVKFTGHKKAKRILKEKIKDWLKLDKKVCYILMDTTSNKFFFYIITADKEKNSKYKTIYLEEKNNIEENIKEYKKIFL